jgi:hypothetical protein
MARNYFAKTTELNYDVQKTDVIVNGQISSDHFALSRSDNYQLLEIHKNSYNPFYNSEFKAILDDLQNITGFENLTYSEFKDGRVVLGYLENNKTDVIVNGFNIDRYLVLGNTHDGTKGIFLGTSEIMLRCMNQFGKIIKSNVIKHTKNKGARLDELKRAYEVYFSEIQTLNEVYKKMSKIEIDTILLESLTKRLFDVENIEEMSTRKSNQINDFNNSYRIESKDLGNNLFAFFNATTHYTTHVMNTNNNVFGNLFGTQAKLNEKAINLTLELI